MSVNKRCTRKAFFSIHFNLQDEKGFSAVRAFKTMYTYSRKIQLCNQNWSSSIHMLPGTKQPTEAYVTKHTKVPVLNIECPFTLSSCLEDEGASVYNVPRAVVMESGSSQHIPGSYKARVIPLLPFDISSVSSL